MEKDQLKETYDDDLLARYLGTLSNEEFIPPILPHHAKTHCNTITISGSYVGTVSAFVESERDLSDKKFYVSDFSALYVGRVLFDCKYALPKEYGELPIDVSSILIPLIKKEPDPKLWRGVFSPNYKRNILFSDTMTINIGALPRLKPKAFIDRRTLDQE